MKTVRIVAPAKQVNTEIITNAVQFFEQEGFHVIVGDNVLKQDNYFAGTLAERLVDFQIALDDENTDFIICARGGYGCVQLIDELDFSKFVQHPKLIIGYSDVTVFHCHIPQKFNVATVHATAPLNFTENTAAALTSLVNVLHNKTNTYTIEPNILNINGAAEGKLVGGNLAILYSLLGTDSDCDYDNKILFIEEIGEAIYAVDRMFYALKKAGKLSQIKGLIVGGMTGMKDSEVPFGLSVEEVIHKHIVPLNIPLVFNFPVGHINDNRAMVINRNAQLSVTEYAANFNQ